jgi:TRAP-type C4-dicarboxylate transport system substrate-binding protein
VYGALQTGMIDAVINSAVALVVLQWHTTLRHMTAETSGALIGGMLMSGKKWADLPPDVQKLVFDEVAGNQDADVADMRKADDRAYQKLLEKGYTAHKWKGTAAETEMNKVYDRCKSAWSIACTRSNSWIGSRSSRTAAERSRPDTIKRLRPYGCSRSCLCSC